MKRQGWTASLPCKTLSWNQQFVKRNPRFLSAERCLVVFPFLLGGIYEDPMRPSGHAMYDSIAVPFGVQDQKHSIEGILVNPNRFISLTSTFFVLLHAAIVKFKIHSTGLVQPIDSGELATIIYYEPGSHQISESVQMYLRKKKYIYKSVLWEVEALDYDRLNSFATVFKESFQTAFSMWLRKPR